MALLGCCAVGHLLLLCRAPGGFASLPAITTGLGQSTEELLSPLEAELPLAQLVLELLGEVVPHQRLPFPLLGQLRVDDVLEAIPEVGLGEAASDPVRALAEGFEEDTAVAQVRRLQGHVLTDVVKEPAPRPEEALVCTALATGTRGENLCTSTFKPS